ncbi:MAG: hypothetical protein HC852_02750 [Acaryochloridaceae cyanobacterium RU_4_10]|nr:hypothetical protein [Acaryochloridaceae cyanobacterium RU_4_10]
MKHYLSIAQTKAAPNLTRSLTIPPYSSQDLAVRLEETGKTSKFNEDRVVHLPQSTPNSKILHNRAN